MEKIYFGGSFNPVCNHHINIALLAARTFAKHIAFMPAYDAPHKNTLISFEHRLNMLKLAIDEYSNLSISLAEKEIHDKNKGEPSYSYNTFRHLAGINSNLTGVYSVSVLLGSDSVDDLLDKKWYMSDEILARIYNRTFKLYVPIRKGEKSKFLQDEKLCQLVKVFNQDVGFDGSSSEFREKYKNKEDVKDIINAKVLDYVVKNSLY